MSNKKCSNNHEYFDVITQDGSKSRYRSGSGIVKDQNKKIKEKLLKLVSDTGGLELEMSVTETYTMGVFMENYSITIFDILRGKMVVSLSSDSKKFVLSQAHLALESYLCDLIGESER